MLPVVGEDVELIGIVTTRDLRRAARSLLNRGPHCGTVAELMSPDVHSVRLGDC